MYLRKTGEISASYDRSKVESYTNKPNDLHFYFKSVVACSDTVAIISNPKDNHKKVQFLNFD